MGFVYAPGSRPLEPYTIKHGIGTGSFGEVYYAVSDGGKEVALKYLYREPEIELRGIRTCLNISHPCLVHLYDLRQASDGNWWLVMEYIAGPTWATLIEQHPHGLPAEKVVFWFQQLAEVVDFLHERGILHRDLKPSNIFLVNSPPREWVKVGDYGLSKCVAGQPSPTHSHIGTVHYMAPEMAQGRYDQTADVYAAGIIAFQLLSGQLPFVGQSVQEIMLRHLTDDPDWSRIPSRIVPVLRTALAKDPAARFRTLGEMANELQRALSTVPVTLPQLTQTSAGNDATTPSSAPFRSLLKRTYSGAAQDRIAGVESWSGRMRQLARSCLRSAALGAILTAFFAILMWNVRANIPVTDFAWMGSFAVVASWALLVPQRLWWDHSQVDVWLRCLVRMVLGTVLGGIAAWLAGAAWITHPPALPVLMLQQEVIAYDLKQCALREGAFFGVLFLLTPWEHLMRVDRKQRFSGDPVILITCLAGLLIWFWHGWEAVPWAREWPKLASLALTATLVQFASPYESARHP